MAVTYVTLYPPGSNQPVQVVEGSQLHLIYAEMGFSAIPYAPGPPPRPDPFPYYVNEDELAAFSAGSIATVVHGANPDIARPSVGTGTVRWVGSVQPAAMTTTDLWVQTTNPASTDPVAVAAWLGAWYADQLVTAGAVDGATVTSWTDAATGTLPLTPTASSTGAAVLDTTAPGYNNRPAVKFTASPLGSPAFTALEPPYSFVIVANVGTTGEETIVHGEEGANAGAIFLAQGPLRWRASNGGGTYPEVSAHADTSPHLFIATYSSDPAVGRLRVDGVETVAATGSTSIGRFRLGLWGDASGNEPYQLTGHVAFAALIDRALTTDEIATLEAWAAAKYHLGI